LISCWQCWTLCQDGIKDQKIFRNILIFWLCREKIMENFLFVLYQRHYLVACQTGWRNRKCVWNCAKECKLYISVHMQNLSGSNKSENKHSTHITTNRHTNSIKKNLVQWFVPKQNSVESVTNEWQNVMLFFWKWVQRAIWKPGYSEYQTVLTLLPIIKRYKYLKCHMRTKSLWCINNESLCAHLVMTKLSQIFYKK
jgi:hypothetical protein